MYSTTISWGMNRETVCEPVTDNTLGDLISRLQSMWNANAFTLNFSAKIMENDKIIYDGLINQYVINGFRYIAIKEMMNNG